MKKIGIPLFALSLLMPIAAYGHREDYAAETLVFLTLRRHEVEPEYWLDFGRRAGADFVRHSAAVEYGLTDHWMADSRISFSRVRGESFGFESARMETRYRFFDEGALPVDVAASGEVNAEKAEQGGTSWGIEPRLILSKDIERLNVTLNLAEEIGLHSSERSFNPSFGIRYDPTQLLRFGGELRYFSNRHAGAVIPQIALKLAHGITLKFAFAYGLRADRGDNFGRLAAEAGFGEKE
jgi:hypothetical protein